LYLNSNTRFETGLPLRSGDAWYALRTKSNQEKIAAASLEAQAFQQYLPLYRKRTLWSDRVIETSVALFPGYVFCRFDGTYRISILHTLGVVSIVSFAGQLAPIADSEIEAIRNVLGSGRVAEPYPYLYEGQEIQVDKGPLRGLEGILIKKGTWRIVISLHMLCRSVAVEIDSDSITPIVKTNAPRLVGL
jgi:transcriptional antiterminator NusG